MGNGGLSDSTGPQRRTKILVKVADNTAIKADHKREGIEASARSNGRRIRVRGLARIYDAVEKLADGLRHEPPKAAHVTLSGIPTNIGGLRALHLIPWLIITRHDDNTVTLEIDQELRAICEARAPRPELNGWSYRAWSRNLRVTITQKRKENHDERMKKRWDPEAVVTRRQTELLDWIENELDKIP
jgi:hypothetical protein